MRKSLLIAAVAASTIGLSVPRVFAQTAPAAPAPAPAAAPADPTPVSTIKPGDDFFTRLTKAYTDEWGWGVSIADPNAPPGHRAAPWPPSPVTAPPFPFTEWPFGGGNPIGATTPNSIDSPLMTALAPTKFGTWLNDNHIQIYGWINPGFNLSTSTTHKNGNFPAAYAYDANTFWLDQAVVIFERLPDTVQKDHIDWGFRVSPIYGETYRYTTAYGFMSNQLQKRNLQNGFDAPMIYGELYIPWVAEGLILRAGRYISVPDIEAQLAPNNYMYSHSMTYAYDNYTNTGIMAMLQVTKNWMIQGGVVAGTDSMPWNSGNHIIVYSPINGQAIRETRDPGMQPSFTGCIRYQSDTAYDTVYTCANALNNGEWGYNNLQQYTLTYYHKFNEQWHLSFEFWHMHQNHVANVNPADPNVAATNLYYALSPFAGLVNGPFGAWCKVGQASCQAQEASALVYINYTPNPKDNFSFRSEFFDDMSGQRTGVKDRYLNFAFGWQHWFSPTVMVRPEVAWYNALDRKAFNRNPTVAAAGNPTGQPLGAQAMSEVIFSADLIWHF